MISGNKKTNALEDLIYTATGCESGMSIQMPLIACWKLEDKQKPALRNEKVNKNIEKDDTADVCDRYYK